MHTLALNFSHRKGTLIKENDSLVDDNIETPSDEDIDETNSFDEESFDKNIIGGLKNGGGENLVGEDDLISKKLV